MKAKNIALHAITAESGGDAAVVARLAKRKTANLPFHVHSDPDHELLLNPQDGQYVKELVPAGKHGKEYTEYNMVQPALEVLDRNGAVIQKWSWYSFDPLPDVTNPLSPVVVDGQSLWLVTARPRSADIVPSVKEGRQVKIGAPISKCGLVCTAVGCAVM